MGELAGDECSIRKRTTSCILRRKRPSDSLRALHPNLVSIEIKGGQRSADQTVKKRAEEGKWGS